MFASYGQNFHPMIDVGRDGGEDFDQTNVLCYIAPRKVGVYSTP